MKKNPSKFFIFGIFLFFVLGCGAFNAIKKGIEETQKPQTMVSSDAKCQITVPGSWRKQTGLHDDAIIQAANPLSELYVIVIPDNKVDFGKSANLDFITKLVRDNLNQTVTAPVISEPVATTINGLPAKQFEVSGEVENIKIKYIYAVIDAPQNYYQVIGWTLTSRYETNKGKLMEVINSFQESGGSSLPPVAATPAKR